MLPLCFPEKMNESHFFIKKLLTNKIFYVIITKMTVSHFVKGGETMASEAVNKILTAEKQSAEKTVQARQTAENIITEAERYSAIAVQKKISQAISEMEKIRSDYAKRLEVHSGQSDSKYAGKSAEIRLNAEKNMEKAVTAVIEEFF